MEVFLAAFVILVIAFLAMAVGVIVSNKRIEGSCGGLASLGIEKACDCDKPCARRRRATGSDSFDVDLER